jgi:hypothetical protein
MGMRVPPAVAKRKLAAATDCATETQAHRPMARVYLAGACALVGVLAAAASVGLAGLGFVLSSILLASVVARGELTRAVSGRAGENNPLQPDMMVVWTSVASKG